MTSYLIASSIILLFVGIIWSRDHIANVAFKVMFLGMGIWGLVLSLVALGYLIKP
jgi:hypothetical protein